MRAGCAPRGRTGHYQRTPTTELLMLNSYYARQLSMLAHTLHYGTCSSSELRVGRPCCEFSVRPPYGFREQVWRGHGAAAATVAAKRREPGGRGRDRGVRKRYRGGSLPASSIGAGSVL